MTLRLALALCATLFALLPSARAGQVTVKEVSLSLYNKPVNGYRVMLDRNQKLVAGQIVKHVTASGVAAPFEFERTIIFENVFYKPVTDSREISLYYLLRTVDAQYTELTLVAMYDYKRCINFRDFPVLAIRMMSDLSELVRKTSGDELIFEGMAYNAQTLPEIEKKYLSSQMNQFGENPRGTLTSEQDADQNPALNGGDPFAITPVKSEDPDSVLKVISLRRRELELKERELARREQELQVTKQELDVTRATLTRQLNHAGALKDSITSLNHRIALLEKQNLTGDEMSVSSDSRELVTRLQGELAESRNQFARLKAHSDSADARLETLSESELSARGRKEVMQKKIAELEEQNALYKEELKMLRRNATVNAGSAALLDSLTRIQSRLDYLEGKEAENVRLRSELADKDALLRQNSAALGMLENEKNALATDKAALTTRSAELEKKLETSAGFLQELRIEYERIGGDLVTSQKQAAALQAQVNALQAKVNAGSAGTRALTDSLTVLQNRISGQRKAMAEKENEIKAQERANDSLSSQLIRAAIRETKLSMQNDSLEAQIDSLGRRSAPVTEQQKFIRDQWEKLEKWDKELKGKETSVAEREKLAAQREAYLQRKENELNRRESQLSEPGRNKPVPTPPVETPVNSGQPASGEFKTELTTEFQQEVPLFCLYTRDGVADAQRKVAAWFINRGFFYKKYTPDFLFENVLLPELSVEPLQVRVRVEAGASGGTVYRISFRKPDYKFIEAGISDSKVESLLRSLAQ